MRKVRSVEHGVSSSSDLSDPVLLKNSVLSSILFSSDGFVAGVKVSDVLTGERSTLVPQGLDINNMR